MDLQKITSTGTAVAVIGTGTVMGGNFAIDNATRYVRNNAIYSACKKEA